MSSPTSDSPSIRPRRSLLPDDLPRGVLPDEQIRSISCGNGDWLLVMSQGWGFSSDGTSLPRARYWRHGAGGWAGAESDSGDTSRGVVFDGHRWTAAPVPEPSRGWERDAPDGGKLTADIPAPRDARAALASVQESFVAPSGDLWAVLDFNKNDCGGCFQYRALVRIRADQFRAPR